MSFVARDEVAAGEVVHFGEAHRIAAAGRVPGDAAPVDAAADDENIRYVAACGRGPRSNGSPVVDR